MNNTSMFNSSELIGINQVNSVDFVRSAFQVYASGDVLVIIKQTNHGLNLKKEMSPKAGGGWLNLKQDVILEDRPAQIVFTSGTEGAPKAILLSHQALADVVTRLNNTMQVDETISEYVGIPVTYSFGLGRCRAVAAVGGRCFIPENGFNPAEIARMLAAGEINAISAVPTLWRTLIVQPEIIGTLGRKVKWIEIGSQYMSRSEKEQMKALFPNAIIVQHYGLTEASRTTFLKVSETEGHLLESVGQPAGNVEVKISPEGLIKIKGAHVASGQIIGEETKALVDSDGWYTTGDYGRIEDNFLYYEGRADDLINCAGVKISPDLLQERINRRLNIEAEVAVCRIEDPLRGDGFFVAIESGTGISVNDVQNAAIDELLALGVNAKSSVKVQEIGNIPRTDTGKVRRKELAKLYSHTAVKKESHPLPDSNSSIAELFADTFPGVTIKPRDTFRSLGGDSLNYIQMLMSLESRLGEAPTDWDKMTVEHLEKLERKDHSSIFSWLDTSAFLRAIAISAVVATHSGGEAFAGGTILLFILIGYNMARFKSTEFFEGKAWPWIANFSFIILIPYYIAVTLYMGWNKSFEIDELLLYTNLIEARISMFFPFWFVQVLIQCLILVGAIFSVPVIRRYASKFPARFSLAALVCLIAVRAIYPSFWNTAHLNDLVPLRYMAILWLGWSFNFVEKFWQKALLCAIGIGFAFLDTGLLWGFDFSSPQSGLAGDIKWLVFGSIFLAFVPRVPVPTITKNIFNDIGAATFYIFIFNGLFVKLANHVVHTESVFIIFCLSLIGSMLLWWGMERLRVIARLQALMKARA